MCLTNLTGPFYTTGTYPRSVFDPLRTDDNVGSLRMCLTNLTGPFYTTGTYPRSVFDPLRTDGNQDSVGNFDLSRTSAIYQDSVSTVQTASMRTLCLVRAY